MQENGLDVQAINPRNGEKYSLNLYQWLSKRDDKMRAWASRVYRDADGSLFVGWPSESPPANLLGHGWVTFFAMAANLSVFAGCPLCWKKSPTSGITTPPWVAARLMWTTP